MKHSIFVYILIILLVILSFICGKQCSAPEHSSDLNDSILSKIETIEYVLSKNDSIKKINDSIEIKVIEVEKVYEKTINNIIHNTPADDYAFFSAYTERYRGYNYCDTTENR